MATGRTTLLHSIIGYGIYYKHYDSSRCIHYLLLSTRCDSYRDLCHRFFFHCNLYLLCNASHPYSEFDFLSLAPQIILHISSSPHAKSSPSPPLCTPSLLPTCTHSFHHYSCLTTLVLAAERLLCSSKQQIRQILLSSSPPRISSSVLCSAQEGKNAVITFKNVVVTFTKFRFTSSRLCSSLTATPLL